ncbi:MAG: ABC transporter permease subunit [Chloroflexi bacterium]|nr:ABC transporter permease subunit [Chloroflexota bacterium]MCY4247370.1 ABC transporter permease subunit [Chloroflexota bacterium]
MNALLEHFVGLLDSLFSRVQRFTGVTGMAYVFVAPNMLVFSIFVLFPMLFNFVYTFTGSDRLFLDQRPYVGAANLERLFDCQDFLRPITCDEDLFASAVLNTASFVVTQVTVMIAVSLLTAVVLNGRIRARGFFRSVFFYPVLLSPIVVAMIWRWMLQENGLFNAFIVSLGGEKLRFLTDRNWARFWVVVVSVWSLMGFYTLILLAGLQAIPADLYEAAAIDGASSWRAFQSITLPMLAPTMLVVIVLSTIRAVQIFDVVFAFTGGGPGSATLYIVHYIYNNGFASPFREYGLAAATSLVMATALIVLTIIQIRVQGTGLEEAGDSKAKHRGRPRLSALAGLGQSLRRGLLEPLQSALQIFLDGLGAALGGLLGTPRRRSALTYGYLLLGMIVMFGPVLWLVMSSFKSPSDIQRFPPRFLPHYQETVAVAGYDEPLPLYNVRREDGSDAQLAQVRRVGLEAQMLDPAQPEVGIIKVKLSDREPVETMRFSLDNFQRGIESFNFWRYLSNSVIVTVAATLLTLLVNSMAAFALSKYRFRGRGFIFMLIISTLMVPLSVILVPAFLLITALGWNNQLIGIIIPTIGTPTGVFLLRQYMLTIPDELLDSARIDGASEWRIYWQVILPLAAPALAVLAIFSTIWRWNDFLWPKIVMTRDEMFTLQVGLETFQGDLTTQWELILAMTVLTALPITFVFGFLQKYITTGIATTGMK